MNDLIELHWINIDLMRGVEFLVQTNLEGYTIEFSIEGYQYFYKVEAVLKLGI